MASSAFIPPDPPATSALLSMSLIRSLLIGSFSGGEKLSHAERREK